MRIRRAVPEAAAGTAAGGAPAERPERPRATPPGELPLVAAITMARDEGPMIKRWVDHYAGQFGAEHVYVVDDHSEDGSTDDLPCTVLRLPYLRKYPFEPSRMGVVSGLASSLLFAYDAVLFCDADEFIVADPRRHPSLRHYVAATEDRQAVAPMGYNVIHDVANEPPLRFDQPFLRQRSYAKFMPLMSKPALKWERADWVRASHGVKCPYEVVPDLVMFHMKFADRDLLQAAAAHRHALNRSEGRAGRTSWARDADEMVALLDEVAATIPRATLKRFRPIDRVLTKIPRPIEDYWKSVGDGQVQGMRKRPLTRIPDRFADLV